MRIAYVVTRADSVGGATIHVLEMARAMLQRGHDALVLIGGDGPAGRRLAEEGVPVRPLRFLRRPVRPDTDLLAFCELTAALRDFRPDLVSTHTAKAGWIGRAACAWLGVPAIYTPHGLPVGDRMPERFDHIEGQRRPAIIHLVQEAQIGVQPHAFQQRPHFVHQQGVRQRQQRVENAADRFGSTSAQAASVMSVSKGLFSIGSSR